MEIILRAAAIQLGRNKYFTGKPCKRGHLSERYVITSGCIECLRAERTGLQVARNLALQGIHPFTFRLHADDHAAARAFCNALNMNRGLAPEADPAVPPPPPPSTWRRFDLWERTHGRPRALLMLAQAGAADEYERALLSDER